MKNCQANFCRLLDGASGDDNARAVNRLYRRVGNRGAEKSAYVPGEFTPSEAAEARTLASICLNCPFYNSRKNCSAPTNKRRKMGTIIKYLRENY
ncbi:MAG: hypothetical protein LBM73_02490 [Candidatus Nomurabacteria bacterium]|jgi:hypothetical protein|nr:hypothetical protein [Candidatus Nomurabacteria bacterium]